MSPLSHHLPSTVSKGVCTVSVRQKKKKKITLLWKLNNVETSLFLPPMKGDLNLLILPLGFTEDG